MALSFCARLFILPLGEFSGNAPSHRTYKQLTDNACRMWYPTVQFTCRIYDPKTKENIWRSTNVSGFVSPMPGSNDKRTGRSDKFTVKYSKNPTTEEESYSIVAQPADDLQITLDVVRPKEISGFKVGKGPKGGNTYFGTDINNPEGNVFHHFWPRTKTTGHVFVKGKPLSANGIGMFVHAIQGMRPNLVASRWNFAHFTSPDDVGVSAVMMEFTTVPDFGKKGKGSGGVLINVGGIVADGKLIAVTGETILPDEGPSNDSKVQSRATHYDPKHDKDTGYKAPTRIEYTWAGPSIVPESPGDVKAVLNIVTGDPQASNGLIEKVDVLAEIPKVIKTFIAYAAGTKPYIYTVSLTKSRMFRA